MECSKHQSFAVRLVISAHRWLSKQATVKRMIDVLDSVKSLIVTTDKGQSELLNALSIGRREIDLITIEIDDVITLLFACEEAIDSLQRRPETKDNEEAGVRAKLLEDLELVHSHLQVSFCGVPSSCDKDHVRH